MCERKLFFNEFEGAYPEEMFGLDGIEYFGQTIEMGQILTKMILLLKMNRIQLN